MEDSLLDKLVKSIEKRHGKEMADRFYYVLALFVLACIFALAMTHAFGPFYFFLKQAGILATVKLIIFSFVLVGVLYVGYILWKSRKLGKKADELFNETQKRDKEHEKMWEEKMSKVKNLLARVKEIQNAQDSNS